MKKIEEMNLNDFLSETASSSPAPGGGGGCAFVGALGVALGNMVGSLTLGKKKYADVEDDMKNLSVRAQKVREELVSLISADAEAFEPLATAYRMKSDTAEEKAAKDNELEICLKGACEVPLEIMRKCCEAIDIVMEYAAKGSVMAISDAGCGAIICKSALQGAALNVFINTKSMKNRELAEKMNEEADELLRKYTMLADEIYAMVFSKLR